MTSAGPGRRARVLAVAGVALLAVLVHAGSLANPFVNWDDPSFVLTNEALSDQGVVDAAGILAGPQGHTYLPLRVFSHGLDRLFWGTNPVGHHLQSLLWHGIASAAAVVLLLGWGVGPVAAAAGGVLWAVHPLTVEPVAWISARKDVLAGALTLGAAVCYQSSLQDRRRGSRFFALGLALFLGSLLAKASGLGLPGFLTVHAWLRPGPRGRRRALGLAAGYAAVAVILGVVHILLATRHGVITDWGSPTSMSRSLVILALPGFYLGKVMFPVDLSTRYSYPFGDPGRWVDVVLGTGLWALALAVLAWACFRRRGGPAILAVAWALCLYMPYSQVARVAIAAADRYAYLPLIGLACLVAVSVVRGGAWGLLGVATLSGACAWGTVLAVGAWSGTLALWGQVRAVEPWGFVGREYYVSALRSAGALTEAAREGAALLERYPSNLRARRAYGSVLMQQDRWSEGRDVLFPFATEPGQLMAKEGLAECLRRAGDEVQALALLEAVCREDRDRTLSRARNNLGNLLVKLGRRSEAGPWYREALGIDPGYAEAELNLGIWLLAGRPTNREALVEAAELLRRAVDKLPEAGAGHLHLGIALGSLGDDAAALHHLRRAAWLEPDEALAHRNLAALLRDLDPPQAAEARLHEDWAARLERGQPR